MVSRMRATSLPASLTLCDPVDHSLLRFSIHGTSQARMLRPGDLSGPEIKHASLALAGGFFTCQHHPGSLPVSLTFYVISEFGNTRLLGIPEMFLVTLLTFWVSHCLARGGLVLCWFLWVWKELISLLSGRFYCKVVGFLMFWNQDCSGYLLLYNKLPLILLIKREIFRYLRTFWDFPGGGSDGKESAYNVGDSGSVPGLGRSPGDGNGNQLQYSCLENPVDGGAW